MANFPTSLTSLNNPSSSDKLNNPSHSTQHANINDEVEAIAAKVGIDSSAVTTSHDYKLSEVTSTDVAVGKSATQTLTNKTLTSPTITSGVAATSFDMNGTELILDADADTSITSDTDDRIDFKAGGTDSLFVGNGEVDLNGSTLYLSADREAYIVPNDTGAGTSSAVLHTGGATFTFDSAFFGISSGASLQTNTIAETTATSGVTIDGLLIKDSKLATADSVVTANYTDASILPEHLVASTGTSWVWQSWTPTFTNWTIGTGGSAGTTAKFVQIGKTVFFFIKSTLGSSGQSVGNNPHFTLPVALNSAYRAGQAIGMFTAEDQPPGFYEGYIIHSATGATGEAQLTVFIVGGSYINISGLTSTTPFTWAAGDSFTAQGYYEAA